MKGAANDKFILCKRTNHGTLQTALLSLHRFRGKKCACSFLGSHANDVNLAGKFEEDVICSFTGDEFVVSCS